MLTVRILWRTHSYSLFVFFSRDDLHLWLAPFTPKGDHFIRITFPAIIRIAMIRIWVQYFYVFCTFSLVYCVITYLVALCCYSFLAITLLTVFVFLPRIITSLVSTHFVVPEMLKSLWMGLLFSEEKSQG